MRWGRLYEELDWHPYFAWWPMRIAGKQWVWLEWIERIKYAHQGSVYLRSYRLPDDHNPGPDPAVRFGERRSIR